MSLLNSGGRGGNMSTLVIIEQKKEVKKGEVEVLCPFCRKGRVKIAFGERICFKEAPFECNDYRDFLEEVNKSRDSLSEIRTLSLGKSRKGADVFSLRFDPIGEFIFLTGNKNAVVKEWKDQISENFTFGRAI